MTNIKYAAAVGAAVSVLALSACGASTQNSAAPEPAVTPAPTTPSTVVGTDEVLPAPGYSESWEGPNMRLEVGATSDCQNMHDESKDSKICVSVDPQGYRVGYYKAGGQENVWRDFNLVCLNPVSGQQERFGDKDKFLTKTGHNYSYVFAIGHKYRACAGWLYARHPSPTNVGPWHTNHVSP